MNKPKSIHRPGSRKNAGKRFSWPQLGFLLAGALVVVIAIGVCTVYAIRASMLDIKDVGQIPQRSFVFDVNGNAYSRLYGQNRVLVKIDDVSPNFIDALLAREDARFYKHGGVDIFGIGRAIVRNISRGSLREGASTITQQLARNSFDLGGRTLDRKILEAFVAFRIEHSFTKRQILEHYINRIYYGSGYYGLEIATQAYFGKPCKNLTLGEAAMMAGLIRSPNRFSPFKNLEGAKSERDTVLARMVELGKISQSNADAARKAPIHVAKNRPAVVQENYVMDAVDAELQNLLTQDQIDAGGMKIYTTIDPKLQSIAEKALDAHLTSIEARPNYPHPKKAAVSNGPNQGQATNYLQGAVVIIDNRSGGICALVGGRDRRSPSDFNRSLFAKRQVGSAIKPFVYAAAYANGLFPGSSVSDEPISPGEVPEAPNWRPSNSDGTNRGTLPAKDGLVLSRNTMTVRVGEFASVKNVRELATKIGLSDLPNYPSSFLGAFEETPRDLTAAYTVFANQGKRRQNYLIERIDDRNGIPIYRAAHIETQPLDPGVAWLTTSAMREVFTRGTATSAKSLGFTGIAAGKTGTTNDFKDAWFIGFTKSLTCGVWVGMDKPEPILRGGYGATLALPIWTKIMKSTDDSQYPASSFDPGVPLRKTLLCSVSNAQATTACRAADTAYTIDLPVSLLPKNLCPIHQGTLAGPETAPDGPEEDDRPPLPVRVFDSFLNLFRKGK
ncbi:MAG TPA: PBP1A family penicillin-binding protein [Chthoniobacterales bacterium]